MGGSLKTGQGSLSGTSWNPEERLKLTGFNLKKPYHSINYWILWDVYIKLDT